jgi:aspartate-semialdehyde dehydrogenase
MRQRVAIVGATGAVGRTLLGVLAERKFPVGALRLYATARSAGGTIDFGGAACPVAEATPEAMRGHDLVFFSAGADISRALAPHAVEDGAFVVDNSYAFRLDPGVPLVVPEVNGALLDARPRLVANPNCSTIQLVLVLAPLHRAAGVERVVVSTYQSVSGTGNDALVELEAQLAAPADEPPPRVYPHPIAFNVIPQVDDFLDNGYCREEMKLVWETRKILGEPELRVTATTVRVPVRIAHSEAVNLTLSRPLDAAEARRLLAAAPGVAVVDDPAHARYPTPRAAAGSDLAFVGRIRRDCSQEMGLDLFIACDNLRKGAATNAVQIAERLCAGQPAPSGAPRA